MSSVRDVVINLLASAIAAAVGWTAQYLVRQRRLQRKRSFLGVRPGAEVLLFVARHAGSPKPESVHRTDVATLVELATMIRESGGLPTLVTSDEGRRETGRVAEYSVGGPDTNPRTAAHFRSALPGVRFGEFQPDKPHVVWVGDTPYQRQPGTEQFALLARVRSMPDGAPAWVIAGQSAMDNLGAVRYLAAHHRALRKTYGKERNFCLLLVLRETSVFGADHVHLVADVSATAFTALDAPDRAIAA